MVSAGVGALGDRASSLQRGNSNENQCMIAQPSGCAIAYVLHYPACLCVLLKRKSCVDRYTPVVLLAGCFELHSWF